MGLSFAFLISLMGRFMYKDTHWTERILFTANFSAKAIHIHTLTFPTLGEYSLS